VLAHLAQPAGILAAMANPGVFLSVPLAAGQEVVAAYFSECIFFGSRGANRGK
jgi:hypothetical protein